jgi:hypothetical protein
MKRLIDLWNAFRIGCKEGFIDGESFGMGLTWADDQDKNEVYDNGVNFGQFFARFAGR